MSQENQPVITRELLFGLINVLIPEQMDQFFQPGLAADWSVWLNPQPEPPGIGLQPARAKAVSRTIITMAALAMNSAENEQNGLRSARAMLGAFVDDFCGTEARRRVILPLPWPRLDIKPNALDVIVAAAQFYSAAQAYKDHPLSQDLASGADRLLQAALLRLGR